MRYLSLLLVIIFFSTSCSKLNPDHIFPGQNTKEDPANFEEIGSIDIGDAGAAEISAFDPSTGRLFVVNNGATNKIDVINLANPLSPVVVNSIDVIAYGGLVNSVAVADGYLAAAIESKDKQQPGKVAVFKTSDYSFVKLINVGALPDMVTFSPDGNYILTANEGEPNTTYTNDPIGTVSVIDVKKSFSVVNVDFASFASKMQTLQGRGLRIFGLNASFAQDLEPEYIAVSGDSRTAWVTLQENNGIAKIDLQSKTVTDIFALGSKDYGKQLNAIDASDRDSAIKFTARPVKGMYQPDAIAVLTDKGLPYLFTANEGDVREYDAFNEAKRVSSLSLDPTTFSNAATLLLPGQLGRLNVTSTLGDINGDKNYEELYSFGARSVSVWNGNNGSLVYDTNNELEQKAAAAGLYDDSRSDDKGVEPEGLALGTVSNTNLVFVGLERADAVAIYDVSNPTSPKFLQILKTGDAPEGVLFVAAKDSPNKRSLLIISSENDGVVRIYAPKKR